MRSNDRIAFQIQDERDYHAERITSTGYFHPLETRTLRDIYDIIYQVLQIPSNEQNSLTIFFKVNSERRIIHYPSELLGYDTIIAVVTDRDSISIFNDSLDTEKSRYVEEHINPMPSFPVHQSQTNNHHVTHMI